ncbi:MAG: hypothetical protein NXI30_13120 [bacterium]|nr:hypothetical protein [bacterium]
MHRSPTSTLLALGLALGLASTAEARPDCFPRLEGDSIVLFETAKRSKPVIVGALWNGRKFVPQVIEEIRVPAPRDFARRLLDETDRGDADAYTDESAGAVVRRLAASTAKEARDAASSLEQVYEAGFVEAAKGGEPHFPAFVAEEIGGTFEAIVDRSIQQMEAYADLVGEVSATAQAFAEAELSEGERDDAYLAIAAELIDLDLVLRGDDCD